jgi:hypothetical protein
LGEKFLYFNDDFFLGSETGPQEYWDPRGVVYFLQSDVRYLNCLLLAA